MSSRIKEKWQAQQMEQADQAYLRLKELEKQKYAKYLRDNKESLLAAKEAMDNSDPMILARTKANQIINGG